jgi:nicotinamidase-related amidase
VSFQIFTPNTPLGDILPELKPQGSETVISKNHPSAFADTELENKLDPKSKLVLTGYMAHVCVSTTARDAARLGYDVVIPLDCIGDRDIPGAKGDDVVDMVAKELGDAFGTIVQSKDIK